MENTYWYAVLSDNEDYDWGTGSYNLIEALERRGICPSFFVIFRAFESVPAAH